MCVVYTVEIESHIMYRVMSCVLILYVCVWCACKGLVPNIRQLLNYIILSLPSLPPSLSLFLSDLVNIPGYFNVSRDQVILYEC